MTNTIDGFTFELPLNAEKIVELAHYHRQQLDEAIFHNEIHLGDYCLAQRKRVYDFTRTLEPQQRVEFYKTYDGELRRIADDEDLHPADAEHGVGVFTIILALALIAFILYFAVVRNITSS